MKRLVSADPTARALALAGIALAVLASAIAFIAGTKLSSRALRDEQNTTAAMCAYHSVLQAGYEQSKKDVLNSEKFMKEHPNGALGFSYPQLVKGTADKVSLRDRQHVALTALDRLRCKDD